MKLLPKFAKDVENGLLGENGLGADVGCRDFGKLEGGKRDLFLLPDDGLSNFVKEFRGASLSLYSTS